jgi:hypothetical protein
MGRYLEVHTAGAARGETDFVLALLARFGGVAEDDYGDPHCWTHDEIASGTRVGGLRFFETRSAVDDARPAHHASCATAEGVDGDRSDRAPSSHKGYKA